MVVNNKDESILQVLSCGNRMVIQRNLKATVVNITTRQNGVSGNSPVANRATTASTTNALGSPKNQIKKMVVSPQMAEGYLSMLKQRYGGEIKNELSGSRSVTESVLRSLELLRINVQSAFDAEIEPIIRKFSDLYFKPALVNIKENLGKNSVSDDVLQKMSCALLENCKLQYNKGIKGNGIVSSSISIDRDVCNKIEVCGRSQTHAQAQKRPAESLSDMVSDAEFQFKRPAEVPPVRYTVQLPRRRQIFWNTSIISIDTKFVLDVQVNQVFGFGSDGKERLATKHPELIRYLPDEQDFDWLIQQNIIPTQSRHSRLLFLVYDEIVNLGQSDIYKHKGNLKYQMLRYFRAPQFMIQKIKSFFVELNLRSKGLISTIASADSELKVQRIATPIVQEASTTSTSPSLMVNITENNATSSVALISSNTNKTKSSLSSSHATLTALLNNNNSGALQVANVTTGNRNTKNSDKATSTTNSSKKENIVSSSADVLLVKGDVLINHSANKDITIESDSITVLNESGNSNGSTSSSNSSNSCSTTINISRSGNLVTRCRSNSNSSSGSNSGGSSRISSTVSTATSSTGNNGADNPENSDKNSCNILSKTKDTLLTTIRDVPLTNSLVESVLNSGNNSYNSTPSSRSEITLTTNCSNNALLNNCSDILLGGTSYSLLHNNTDTLLDSGIYNLLNNNNDSLLNENNDILLDNGSYALLSEGSDALINNSNDILSFTDFVNFNDVNF